MIPFREYLERFIPDSEPSSETENTVAYIFEQRDHRDRFTITENTVIHNSEQFLSGTNKYSGAEWSRWATHAIYYYSLKQERENVPLLRMYRYERKTRTTPAKFQNQTRDIMYSYSYIHKTPLNRIAIRDAFPLVAVNYLYAKKTGNPLPETVDAMIRVVSTTAYPTLKFFDTLPTVNLVGAIIHNAAFFRGTTDIRQFVQARFGKKYVRKDFIKTLRTTPHIHALDHLSIFKRFVPADWVIELMKTENNGFSVLGGKSAFYRTIMNKPSHRNGLMKLLKPLTLPQRKRVLFSKNADPRTPVRWDDVYNLLAELPADFVEEHINDVNLTNANTIHDSISAIHRKYRFRVYELPQNELMKKLDNRTFNIGETMYTIKTPKTTDELWGWGKALGNCIYGYRETAYKALTTLLAIEDDHKQVVVNIEIKHGVVQQFYGRFNARPPQEISDGFYKLLDQLELDLTDLKLTDQDPNLKDWREEKYSAHYHDFNTPINQDF